MQMFEVYIYIFISIEKHYKAIADKDKAKFQINWMNNKLVIFFLI